MLMPKKVKYRKQQRGRMRGKAWRGSDVSFGDYGLKALEPCWLTDRQIEAARVAMSRASSAAGRSGSACFPTSRSRRSRRKRAWARARARRSSGSPSSARPHPLRDGRRDRGRGAQAMQPRGREAADPDEVRDAVCRGEGAMTKVRRIPGSGRGRTGCTRARTSTISCSGCASRSRWDSSRRPTRFAPSGAISRA